MNDWLTENLILAEPVDRPSALTTEECKQIAKDAGKRIGRDRLGGDLLERAYEVETPQQLAVVLAECLARLPKDEQPTPANNSDVLLIQEAAEYLGYEISGLRKLAKEKKIRSLQNGTGPYRFHREWLDEFLEENSNGPEDIERAPARAYRPAIQSLDGFDASPF